MFKITSFEEHLQTDGDGSIRCHFDTINLNQSGFGITYSFKILVSEGKNKNNLKNRESQKKKKKKKKKNAILMYYLRNILLRNLVVPRF